MPRQYAPEARKRARELYMAGLSLDEAARKMRGDGYPYINAETLRRWTERGGWAEAREKLQAEEGRAALALDAERVTAEMLESYDAMRRDAQTRLADGSLDFADGVNLILKIDSLRRQLLAQHKSGRAAQVDRPALWLEFMANLVGDLAEIDPGALAALEPLMDALKERALARLAEAA